MNLTANMTAGDNYDYLIPMWAWQWPQQQAWQCPRCGRVNAPWVSECPCSTDHTMVFTASDTEPPDDA
jgi:hypothetical protein